MEDSKVIRISNDTLDMLEDYRSLKIQMYEDMISEFPSCSNEVRHYKEMSLASLLNDAVFEARFYNKDLLKKM